MPPMNPKRDGAPSQDTPSSFALPVVSGQAEAARPRPRHEPSCRLGPGRTPPADAWPPRTATARRTGAASRSGSARPSTWRRRAPSSPSGADLPPTGVARREFMQLLGASLALAGATACTTRPPDERIVPYTKTPPELAPGNPLHYASGMTFGRPHLRPAHHRPRGPPRQGRGQPAAPGEPGRRRRLRAGVPALPVRPAAAPACCARARAAALACASCAEDVAGLVSKAAAADGGARLRFLTEPNSSPLMGDLRSRIQQKLPNARFYSYTRDRPGRGAPRPPARVRPAARRRSYDFAKADVVLSLDADFLESRPAQPRLRAPVRATAATRRRARSTASTSAEPRFSITGGMADHRLRVQSSDILAVAAAVAAGRGRPAAALPPPPPARRSSRRPTPRSGSQAVAADLRAARGPQRWSSPVSVSPPRCTPWPTPSTRRWATSAPPCATCRPAVAEHLAACAGCAPLVEELKAGKVDTLVITAWNPVYALPADVGLPELLDPAKNPNRAKLNVIYTLALRGRDRPRSRTGSSPRRTRSRPGATAARSTAPSPSSSRSSSRSSTA